jgi:hypothetical protein
MDGPKNDIYEDTESDTILHLHELMRQTTKETGAEFLDLSANMRESYEKNGKKFSFEIDGHWNQYGHTFVAEKVAEVLTSGSTQIGKSTIN